MKADRGSNCPVGKKCAEPKCYLHFGSTGEIIARSSNGRTSDSESEYLGSNPSLAVLNTVKNC